jgi:hypothetical protein
VKSRATEDARTSLQVTRIDVLSGLRFHARANIRDRRGAQVSADPANSLVFGSWAYRYLALRFAEPANGNETGVIVAASTVAIVAIAAAVIVVALLAWYVLPRGGRRKRSPRS